jgi:hypothetical protein
MDKTSAAATILAESTDQSWRYLEENFADIVAVATLGLGAARGGNDSDDAGGLDDYAERIIGRCLLILKNATRLSTHEEIRELIEMEEAERH